MLVADLAENAPSVIGVLTHLTINTRKQVERNKLVNYNKMFETKIILVSQYSDKCNNVTEAKPQRI